MKRFIVLVLAAMLLLLLCSCGADGGKGSEMTSINASAAVMRRECRRF